jgi:hypothetical protein
MPSTLELGKATYKWGKAGFMIFTIKQGLVPSPKGIFHWEIDKATVGTSLKANTTDKFLIGDVGLVFQKEVIFEYGKFGGIPWKASQRWTKMVIWRIEFGFR